MDRYLEREVGEGFIGKKMKSAWDLIRITVEKAKHLCAWVQLLLNRCTITFSLFPKASFPFMTLQQIFHVSKSCARHISVSLRSRAEEGKRKMKRSSNVRGSVLNKSKDQWNRSSRTSLTTYLFIRPPIKDST